MDSNELIELFYNRTYEKFVNKQILDDKNYIVPCQQLINYVHELIKIPYIDFINYLKQNREKQKIDVSDITQFSSFSVCEIEMCNALLWANNPGCQYVDIGRFFPNKVSHRNDGAYRKYGENHIKASAQLGLTFEYYKYWYLSCIGYIFPDLDSETREKLLARTLTRNMLYQQMLLDILEHDVNPVTYMDPLSEKTVRRRFRNVCFFLRICLKECKNQNINTYNILFEHNNLIAAPLLIIDKRSQLKGKTLSDEDIWVLFESYKNGDKKALNMLIKSHQKLVTDMASLYKMEGVLLEDIIQEGNIGLLTAIERFDHFSYASFSNYAKAWIFQAIYAAMISLPYLVRLSNLQFTLYRKIGATDNPCGERVYGC